MVNTTAEHCRSLHAVVNDPVSESGSDLFLMRSTIKSLVRTSRSAGVPPVLSSQTRFEGQDRSRGRMELRTVSTGQ